MSKKYNNHTKHDLYDLAFDHTMIFGGIVAIMASIFIAGVIVVAHKCELETIKHRKEMEIEETIEKAKICQETGYCNSKNINIDYNNEEEK